MGHGGPEDGERGSRQPVETRNTEMRVAVCESMCGSMYTCVRMYVCKCVGVRVCAHASMRLCVSKPVCVHVCAHLCLCIIIYSTN